MFRIVDKQILGENIKRIDVVAEHVVHKFQTGQYVVVIPQENEPWIPIFVTEVNVRRGTIALIFEENNTATKLLGGMSINQKIFSIIGPLGNPATIDQRGTVVCVAFGVDIARILPICRAFKKCGNKVIGVIGAQSKSSIILETQMRLSCQKILMTTEDGSYERRGYVSRIIKEVLDQQNVDLIYTVGPVEVMQRSCAMANSKLVKSFVQLHPPLFGGIPSSITDRVRVGNEMQNIAEHGPEFAGDLIDFDFLQIRINACHSHSEQGHKGRNSRGNPKEEFAAK